MFNSLIVRRIFLPVVFIVLWYLVTHIWMLMSPILLPPVGDVLQAAVDMTRSLELLEHAADSLKRVILGFIAATVLGLSLGTIIGLYRKLEDIADGMVSILRPIPPLAWIPIAILWFGIGDASGIFIVTYAAFFPILLNTIAGVRDVDRILIRAAKSLGANDQFIVRHVILPAALPSIMTGLRIGLGISWMAIVAAELIAAQSGLGYMIEYYRRLIMTEKVVLGMITIGVIGFIMDLIFRKVQNLIIPWRKGLKI
jgi:NitT/TauT family transport system permease protein